jgi:hypothetical protein
VYFVFVFEILFKVFSTNTATSIPGNLEAADQKPAEVLKHVDSSIPYISRNKVATEVPDTPPALTSSGGERHAAVETNGASKHVFTSTSDSLKVLTELSHRTNTVWEKVYTSTSNISVTKRHEVQKPLNVSNSEPNKTRAA